jgi:DinB superfamily
VDRRRRLIEQLDRAWIAFRESYAGLARPILLAPGVTKTWSIKDIIAHVTTWEEEGLKHLPAILEDRKPPRYSVVYGGIDAFNALMTAKKANLSLAEVLEQQEHVHRRIVEIVERAPEDALVPEARFRRRLRLDTYGHYPKHTAAIRQWRERSETSRSRARRVGAPTEG